MTVRAPTFWATFAVIAGASLPQTTHAQVRGSERSVVSQVSDGTTITIDYARPQARGRVPVFGGLVPWGHVWTPGANEATTFSADKDVIVNGNDVPAGRYSVWVIPNEGAWEVVFDPNDDLYHTQKPSSNPDQIRFEVAPDEAEFTEVLTFDFPMVSPTGMDLRFTWGTASLPFPIAVQPSSVLTVEADQAALLVGQYEMTFQGPPPAEAPPGMEMPPPMEVNLRYEGDQLVGDIKGAPPGMPSEFLFVPVADFVFNPAWMMNGRIMETEVDMYFEFNVSDGEPAAGFDVRGLEDRLMMRGQRNR